MNIEEWNPQVIKFTDILSLYENANWCAYTNDTAALETALHKSLDVYLLTDNKKVVGLIRTIGDSVSIVYIQDLLIHSSYQRKGYGKQLIQTVLTKYKNVRQIVLLTSLDESTTSFYESCGFVKDRTYDCISYLRFK